MNMDWSATDWSATEITSPEKQRGVGHLQGGCRLAAGHVGGHAVQSWAQRHAAQLPPAASSRASLEGRSHDLVRAAVPIAPVAALSLPLLKHFIE